MSIQNLKIHNFRSIEKLDLALDSNTKVLCLVGENGSAKTSVLGLIAEAIVSNSLLEFPDFSIKDGKRYRILRTNEIHKDKEFYSVELNYKCFKESTFNFKKLVCRDNSVPNAVYSEAIQGIKLNGNSSIEKSTLTGRPVENDYLASNLLLIRPSDRYEKDGFQVENEKSANYSTADRYVGHMPFPISVSHSGKNLQTLILDMLFDAQVGYPNSRIAFNSISTLLKAVTGKDFGTLQVTSSPYRQVLSSTLGSITSLSQGELDLLVTISSILNRQLFFFDSYPEEQKKTNEFDTVFKVPGVVMIDELDLHLHPRAQEKYIKVLTDVFPNIQFIITTHSPFVVRGLPEHSKVVNLPSGRVFSENFQTMDIDSITNIIFDYDGGFSEEVKEKFNQFKSELVLENPDVELLKSLYKDLSTSSSAKDELGLYLASYAEPELITEVKEC